MLDLDSTVCCAQSPIAAEVSGETVLMSLERSRCYGLGAIGSDIWSRLKSPVRVRELVEALNERYDAPAGLIERDVLDLLHRLEDEGLVRVF